MRAMPPPTPPPISAARWFEDGAGEEDDEAVGMTAFVVVMRLPLVVTTDTTETMLIRLDVDWLVVLLVVGFLDDVEVDADVDVEVVVVDDEDEDDDDVIDDEVDVGAASEEVLSSGVVSWPPLLGGTPLIVGEPAAGPWVLMEATEVPSANGKKSLVSVLSQHTLETFRL